MQSPDPTVVSVVVVTAEDIVSALETNLTSDQHAVLRLTPPFSGRMRARLHVEQGVYDGTLRPVHIEPETLLEDPPTYPRPAETERALRSDPERTYTVENHHEYHRQAVAAWRETVPEAIRERAEIPAQDGRHSVTIAVLGGVEKRE